MRTIALQSLLPGAGSSFLCSALALCASRECRVLLCDLTKSHSTTLSVFNLPLDLKISELKPRQGIELSPALTYYPHAYYSARAQHFAAGGEQLDFVSGLAGLLKFFASKDFELTIIDAGCKDSAAARAAAELVSLTLTVLRPNSASMCALSESVHRQQEYFLFNQVLFDSKLQADLMLFASSQVPQDSCVPFYIPYDDDVLAASLNNTCVMEQAPYSAAARAVENLYIFCLLQTDPGLSA